MRILLSILLLINGLNSFAQIRTSVQTGNWGTATTWDCGCVPAPTENAVIANGHTVTLTANTTINGLTINTGGTLDDNGKIMTVTGNLILNGNLDGSRDLNLTGSGATIDGTGTKSNNMGSVTISNGNKTILTSANLSIAGTFEINNGLTVTNYGAITIALALTGGNASSTWINESNSTLNAGNTVLNTGTLTASAAGNTVNYNRAGAQTVKMPGSSTYSNLNIEGNNTKTLPGNIIVSGNLTIASTLDCNNFNINLGGNWNNSGVFLEQTASVTFDGSGAQFITNTLGETFYNLTLNKSAGTLTLNNNVIISNALAMTAGRVDATTGTLTLGTACGNEGILTYTAGAVIGKFERWINTVAPTNFLFPVGTSSDYRPALITFNVLSPCGSLIGEFVVSDPGINGLPLDDGISPDSIRNTFAEGYWTLTTANGLGGSDYNLELTGNGFTSFPINASTRLLTRSDAGSPWNNPPPGTHVAATGNTAKRNNITVISAQYAFGDTTQCDAPVTSVITGPDSVCNSALNVQYSVDLHLGSVYTWTITGGTQSGGGNTESITVNWGSAGMAGNVRVVENNGCSNGVPVDKAVNIHTLPTSSITGSNTVAEFTNGEPYSVTARPGYTYTWTITGGNLASGQGTNSITVNWLGAGTGNVRCVASTGCPGSADPVDLPVTIYAIITSIASGAWGATTTWDCSCVPPTTGSVVIASPYTVTLSANTTINNFTINTGGTLSGANRIMTVTGNLTVSGTYTSTNSIKLTGTGNATIGGTGTISATGDIRLEGGNVNIASSANLTVSSGNLIFNKAGLSVSNNGSIAFDFNIANGMGTVTFINEANSTLKIGGTIDGVFSASATGNTVNYSGGGVQNIKCPSSGQYYNLSVSNAGTKTLTCNIDIDGNVSISGTAQLDVSSYNLNVAGNWANTSSNADPFFERAQTVTFDGTGTQSITYTPGETFYNLTVNKLSGTLTLNDNVTATNALTMSGGNIDAGSDTLKLGSPAGDGTLSWTSGTVIGRLQRWLSSTGGKLFPIGISSDYRPALVTFTSLTGGSLTAQFVGTNPGVNGLPLNDAGVNIYNTFTEGFWDLTAANGLSSTNYDLDLTGNGFTSYTINSSTRILKRTSAGNPWTLDGIHAAASGNTAKRTGLNGISDYEFCFGDTSACAPPATSPISGPDSVCTSQTGVSYSVTPNPLNTYTWTITGGVQSGGGNTSSITVNWNPAPGGAGNVNVVERSNCGDGNAVNLAVNKHTLPTSTITGRDAVVEFTTGEIYSVTNNTGYTYAWTITGGTLNPPGQNGNSVTVDWGVAGAGNVNVVASSNCTPDAAPVDLPVTVYGTITSIKTGNWDGDTTWNCACIPLITDNIVVASPHTVTLTVSDTVNNITINSGGTLDNGTNSLTITSNYTINGTHSGTGNIILSGTGTTIAGTGTISNTGELQITVGNKTIVSSASLTKSSGNFSIATAVTVINNGTITTGGDIVGNAASSTWVNGTNATLNIGGALLSTGTLTASATGNTINYNGAAGQNIKLPSSSYYHLTASGGGTKTLTWNIDVNGNLTINSIMDVSPFNYNINLAGGWNNTGTFNEQNGTVIIDGSGAQSLTNIAGETFYNLTVNKSAGTFTLNDNVTVSNALVMTAGNINTGTDILTLGTSTANTGALTYTSGNIIGKFNRWKNSTPASLTFPVGTSTNYRPALVTFNSVVGGSLTGEFIASAPGNNGMPVVDGAFTIDTTFTEGYWTLTAANGLSSSDYNLELTGNGFTSFTITAATRLLSRATAGSPWDNPPNGSHVAADPAANTAKRSGLSSFTQYAFGDTAACAGPATSGITGDDSVCTGVTGKIYFVTNNPGNTYTWTVVGGTIASGQGTSSITINWGSTARADANVRVIETDVCTNGTPVDLAVTIHTLPTSPITGNNSVAEGTLGEPYSVTNTPGYTYTWEIIPGTNGTIDLGQFTNSITVNWGAASSETVRVTASTGCGAATPVDLPVTIYSIITSANSGNWNDVGLPTWSCACVPPTTGSVVIQSIHNVSIVQNQTINNLTINGTVTNNGFILTVTGNFTLNGSYGGTGELNLDGTGTTIDGTGTISNTGTVRIRNGNKTILSGTDITKVQGGSFTILGGLTVTNNGNTMTIASDIIGGNASSTWVNGANSTLKVYANVLTTGTLVATASNNTVEYYGDAAQNVKQTTYYNLSVTGSGGKTTLNANMNMTGNMNITDTLDANGFNISVGGNWTNSGGGRFIPGTGKVIFNGTGANTINNGTQAFNNLDIAGSGTKTLVSNLVVNGNLAITSTLDAGADYPVNIKGNWSNTGTFNANNGTVTFDGTVLQTLQNTTTFNNLTINNAAGVSVTSGANNLIGTMTLTNGSFNTNNSFTLISNSSATARIAAITGGDIFGDIIMQRYVNAGATGWHFISSAVSGTTVNDWDQEMILSIPDGNEGCSGSPCYYSVYRYDEATPGAKENGYVAVTTVAEPINPGEGYWVYTGTGPSTTVPFTFDTRGPANKFAESLSVSYTPSGLPSEDGWNMVSNPYPSTIDWDNIPGWTKTNMTAAIYIWDPDAGVYASYVTGVGGNNGGSRFIPSSQAFWVKATAAPTLTATETVKSALDQSYFKITDPPGLFRLSISGAGFADETVIHFAEGASFAFDSDMDAYKLSYAYSPAPYLATVIEDSTDLSINTLPELTQDTSIPLRVKWGGAWWINGETGTFTISTSDLSTLPLSACILLEDMQTGISTNLRTDSSYTFTLSDTALSPRFLIHLGAPVIKAVSAVSCFDANDGVAIAQGNGTGPWDYEWTTGTGDTIKVTQNIFTADTISNLTPGVYYVKVTNGSALCGDVSDSIIITEPDPITVSINQTNVNCKGGSDGSATLTASGGVPPYAYLWNDIAATTAATASNLPAGNYNVIITDNNGCTQTAYATITEPPTIISAGFTVNKDTAYLYEGGAVQFTNNSTGASSYQWNFGDGTPVNTSTNPAHSYSNTGTFLVTLIAINGTCQDTFTYNVIILENPPVSIRETVALNESIKILSYKNGAIIEFNFDLLTELSISVCNLLGQKVIADNNISVKHDRMELDLPVRGIYFIKIVFSDSHGITRKFNYFK